MVVLANEIALKSNSVRLEEDKLKLHFPLPAGQVRDGALTKKTERGSVFVCISESVCECAYSSDMEMEEGRSPRFFAPLRFLFLLVTGRGPRAGPP